MDLYVKFNVSDHNNCGIIITKCKLNKIVILVIATRDLYVQIKPLNVITLGQIKSEKINRMLTITDNIYFATLSEHNL